MAPRPRWSTRDRKDLLRAVRLAVGTLPASLLPAPVARWGVELLLSAVFRLRPGKPAALAARMQATLGPLAGGADLLAEARHLYGNDLEEGVGRMQSLLWRAWRPAIEVEGLERLKGAQALGRGVVLWRMSFGSSLILKAGLWRVGIPLVHLSARLHGSRGKGWIARAVLAPFYRRTEGRYLKERVVIPLDGSTTTVMKTLLARLSEENAVVSIVGDQPGTQEIATPFFDGQARFAMGAPALAWKTGATLLPTFNVRLGALRYRVVLEEPIAVDTAMERKRFVQAAVEEYARRMQAAIARYPGSWSYWNSFWAGARIFRSSSAAQGDG